MIKVSSFYGRLRVPTISTLAVIGTLALTPAHAETKYYKWVDAQGSTHYTELPPPNVKVRKKAVVKVNTYTPTQVSRMTGTAPVTSGASQSGQAQQPATQPANPVTNPAQNTPANAAMTDNGQRHLPAQNNNATLTPTVNNNANGMNNNAVLPSGSSTQSVRH